MDENGVPHRNNDSSRPWRYGHHRQPQREGQSPHAGAPIAYLARASQCCLWKYILLKAVMTLDLFVLGLVTGSMGLSQHATKQFIVHPHG